MAHATATRGALMTAEELLLLPSDVHCELVEGVVVEVPFSGARAASAGGHIAMGLHQYAERTGKGRALGAGTGFVTRRSPDTVRAARASFTCAERLPGGRLPEGYIEGAPDVAVEAVSPWDLAGELQAKVEEYLSSGSRVVWVAYPGSMCVHVFRADGTVSVVREDGVLSGEDVLPGLEIPLSEVFA